MDTPGKYAFLSYSRQDSAIAEALTAALAQRGVRIWRDVEQIEPGSRWEVSLEKGLLGAEAIILLASKHAAASRWIQYEVGAFLERGKLVLPLILDAEGPQALQGALRTVQWLDISGGFEKVLEKLLEPLRRAGVVDDKPVSRAAPKTKGYVFLSYAAEDDDFLEVLRPFLKTHQYAYWDFQESDRDYHSQFLLELEKIIEDAAATLAILSPSWKRSKWTIREFLFSEDVGTPVLLLHAKQMPPTLAIEGIPYIDFVPNVQSGLKKLHKELQRKGL